MVYLQYDVKKKSDGHMAVPAVSTTELTPPDVPRCEWYRKTKFVKTYVIVLAICVLISMVVATLSIIRTSSPEPTETEKQFVANVFFHWDDLIAELSELHAQIPAEQTTPSDKCIFYRLSKLPNPMEFRDNLFEHQSFPKNFDEYINTEMKATDLIADFRKSPAEFCKILDGLKTSDEWPILDHIDVFGIFTEIHDDDFKQDEVNDGERFPVLDNLNIFGNLLNFSGNSSELNLTNSLNGLDFGNVLELNNTGNEYESPKHQKINEKEGEITSVQNGDTSEDEYKPPDQIEFLDQDIMGVHVDRNTVYLD